VWFITPHVAVEGPQTPDFSHLDFCIPVDCSGSETVNSVVCVRLSVCACHCTPCLKKTSKIIFVITTSNFHQIWQFLAQWWQIV